MSGVQIGRFAREGVTISQRSPAPAGQPIITVVGPTGLGGEGGGGSGEYRHVQSTPAARWTVTHNLGTRPTVSVTDTSGSQIEGQVKHLSENVVQLDFSAAFAGEARFS